MGRRSHARALSVWMNGQHVGDWSVAPQGPAGGSFRYTAAWRHNPARRPLSLSLPIPLNDVPLKGPQVSYFFDNLLPDSDAIRRRIQQRFGTASQDAFDLLAAIGRDCVGAIHLLPPGEPPTGFDTIRCEPLNEHQVEQWLHDAVSVPASVLATHEAGNEDFRISIAGAQEKTALLRHGGQWCKPLGATPTTHIFKLPLGLVGNRRADMSSSVENEWLCAQVMNAFGVPTAGCEIGQFGAQKVLIVERFDRRLSQDRTRWLRLPQEDFCQALGVPAGSKYESHGGPGVADIATVLAHADQPARDLATFFKAQFLFCLMAATDGHAKNFSLQLLVGEKYQLTPLYDVLSAWPIIGPGLHELPLQKVKLAMAQRGKHKHYHVLDLYPRHFIETARRAGHGRMAADIEQVLDTLPAQMDAIGARLPSGFPAALFEAVRAGMAQMRERCVRVAGEHGLAT